MPHRIEAAEHFGGKTWTNGVQVDVAFECAGENAAVEDAITVVNQEARYPRWHSVGRSHIFYSFDCACRKGLTIEAFTTHEEHLSAVPPGGKRLGGRSLASDAPVSVGEDRRGFRRCTAT